jgi:hypothetical protein
MENIYKEYAEAKQAIKDLETKADLMKKAILHDLEERGVKCEKKEFGSFSLVSKKSWKYTPAVEKLNEDLKMLQFEEQEKGIAKASESHYLMFKEN